MIDQRDSLAREVDEELRREQLLKLWEKYGTYVVAAIALIVVGVGGVKYYQYRSTEAAEAAGARLAAATRRPASEGSADMQKILQEIGSAGPAGYATLARFRLAAADRDAGRQFIGHRSCSRHGFVETGRQAGKPNRYKARQ